MDPIYHTDDYPRNCCRIEIVVPPDGPTGLEWSVRIYHPVEQGPALESYAPKTLNGAIFVAECLAAGIRVPPNYYEGKPGNFNRQALRQ